ncbi:papain-like cysteine protease family protein [Citrobacter sedlakii]|uniref:papain-like cysteine protease family protein n=1 Tax=Citrobacter sedlakii TaxID=67826 RepID=UPI00197FA02B|nr:papain-like cysteine protease family protein [Citrobacter sedlakii]EHG7582290.1 hypothetical protein [Citrobacter sedlakii]MBN6599408.1 hypothetical protein [Citrobacter sedlakii]HCJ6321778.1 hypothetical protein [Citrobacter sedlakii]
MFASVRNLPIKRQTYKTSCWISTAHYTLRYLNLPDLPSLKTLEDTHYAPDAESASSMAGAGKPESLIEIYGKKHGFTVKTMWIEDENEREIIDSIYESIRKDIPVIAGIRTPHISGFGHAVVITAINKESGTLAFKDPSNINSSNFFASDIKILSFKQFKNGFPYRYNNTLKSSIWAYCSRIIIATKE